MALGEGDNKGGKDFLKKNEDILNESLNTDVL